MDCPLFSIIIPHKDIPDLLMRCLRSIPVSEDIQVIVVDDNSADADTYLKRYPELSRPYLEFIRTTKGGGAGYARNVGLDYAKGKWLLFADADDFFVEGMKDIIFSHVNSMSDVIFFRKKNVSSSDISRELNKQGYLDRAMDTYFQTHDEWPIRFCFSVPYCKMIKSNLVSQNNIRFDEVKYSNDCFFSVCVGYYAEMIEATNEILYYKTDRSDSLTANFYSKPNELRIRSEVFFRIDKFLFQHNLCREKRIIKALIRMLHNDRTLYKYYFNYKLREIYPSRWSAIKDICLDRSFKFKVKVIVYSLLIWKS